MIKSTVASGLLLAIVLDTAGQLLWKVAATSLPYSSDPAQILSAILAQPYFLIVGIIFVVQLINWLFVLERADLSYAQPITSLSYVTVCTLSALQLGEHIGLVKAIGIGCILLGVWCLSRSSPTTKGTSE